MAINAKLAKVSMQIRADGGTDAEGKPIVKVRTVSGVNKEATNEQINESAKQIESLYADETFEEATRVDYSSLVEE